MQQLQTQRKFCEAREILTDNELHRLADKYHHRHPTFTIDIQERTCKTIILACVYYYRSIQIDLRCQCMYNDNLQKFQSSWSTDNVEYKNVLQELFLRLNFVLTYRSLDDQIETIIEQLTKYFTRLKPIQEERKLSSIEIIKYEQSPLSRRKENLERSASWSQSIDNSNLNEKNV